jgi:hypothetical protein
VIERTHEEIGCKRARECEERIHPAERPVDQKQLRRGGKTDRDEPCTATRDAPREVVTERHGRECEQDRDPPHRLRRRVDGQRSVGEEKVKRSAAAVEHDGVQEVAERP